MDLPFLGISYKGSHMLCALLRLTSFTEHDVFDIHPHGSIYQYLVIIYGQIFIPLPGYSTFSLSICLLICIWFVSTFWRLWIQCHEHPRTRFLWGYMYSLLLGTNLGVKLLGRRIKLFNQLSNFQILFQKSGCTILHSLQHEGSNISTPLPTPVLVCLFDYSHPSGCKVPFLMCISLMANDIEYLLVWVLAIRISSLEKCVLIFFPCVWVGYLPF